MTGIMFMSYMSLRLALMFYLPNFSSIASNSVPFYVINCSRVGNEYLVSSIFIIEYTLSLCVLKTEAKLHLELIKYSLLPLIMIVNLNVAFSIHFCRIFKKIEFMTNFEKQ